MSRRAHRQPDSPDFAPVRMDDVDLSRPLPDLPPGESRHGEPFAASLCLVRRGGQPLGLVEAELGPDGLPAAELAARIEAELGERAASPGADGGRERPLADAPTLSVIVCTRNRPDSVRITLRSILACRYPPDRWEAIVVDNAAEADPSIVAAAAELDGEVPIRVVHEPVPGLSNARNCGLRHARGEIVVYGDDDVEVDPEWLAVLAAPFAEERVGATSGLTLPGSLETPVERWTESPLAIGLGFLGTTAALVLAHFSLQGDREQPTLAGALLLGVAQGLAVLPGLSRSGTTMNTRNVPPSVMRVGCSSHTHEREW